MEKYIPVGKLVAMQVFVKKCDDDPKFLSEHQSLFVLERTDYLG